MFVAAVAVADVEFNEIFCLIGQIASDALATTSLRVSFDKLTEKRIGHTIFSNNNPAKQQQKSNQTVAVGCWRRKNVTMLRFSLIIIIIIYTFIWSEIQ